jgi:hypothetical protein
VTWLTSNLGPVTADEIRFKCVANKSHYDCSADGCRRAATLKGYSLFRLDPGAKVGTVQGCDDDGYCEKNLGRLPNVEKVPDGFFTMVAVNIAFMPGILYEVGPGRFVRASLTGGWITAEVGQCSTTP